MRRSYSGLVALCLAGGSIVATTSPSSADPSQPAAVCGATTCTTTYTETGSVATFTVPSFVTEVSVTANGAQGGKLNGTGKVAKNGARGGRTSADAPVTPGDVLSVIVGGQGGATSTTTPGAGGAGGFGGGAAGGESGGQVPGTGGGGGTFVFFNNDSLMLAAGGGGGRSVNGIGTSGEGGGGLSFATAGANGSDSATGGQPGTGTADGAGGAGTSVGASNGNPGTGSVNGPSVLPVGGAGGGGGYGGGGGGGGRFAGGGGGSDNNASPAADSGSGGGGGNGYYAGNVTNVTGGDGLNSGNGSVTITYAKGTTATTVSVQPTTITAAVATDPAGGGTPTGSVSFSVDGTDIGIAPLKSGVARLGHTIATGATHSVSATYSGDDNFLGSTGAATRSDPTVTDRLSSRINKPLQDWYRTPVTVTFHCTPTTAPLTTGCPAPVTMRRSAKHQSVRRTVTATDGGAATVLVSGINIDRVKPTVKIKGAKPGKTYRKRPKAHCVGHDALSGLKSCTLRFHGNGQQQTLTATATDVAGNTRRRSIHIKIAA